MTPEQFCYWLQGFYELSGEEVTMSAAQVAVVRSHLGLVFHHVLDKEHDGGDPKKAAQLNQLHSGSHKGPVKYRC